MSFPFTKWTAIPGLAFATALLFGNWMERVFGLDISPVSGVTEVMLRPLASIERHFWPDAITVYYGSSTSTVVNGPPAWLHHAWLLFGGFLIGAVVGKAFQYFVGLRSTRS